MIFVTNRLPYDRTREVGRVTESLPRNDAYALILFLLFFWHATLVRQPPHLLHLLLWPCTQGSRAYTGQQSLHKTAYTAQQRHVDTFPDHTFYVSRPHLLRIKNRMEDRQSKIDNQIEDQQSKIDNRIEDRQSKIDYRIENRQSNRRSTIENRLSNRRSAIENRLSNRRSAIENRLSNQKSTIESKIDNRNSAI